MSRAITRTFIQVPWNVYTGYRVLVVAQYSKGSNAADSEDVFKVVKSRARTEKDLNMTEGGPNWELLSPRGNRFFFPNLTGPAWQGANTTIHTEVPLNALVDFEGQTRQQHATTESKLNFNIADCPSLIKSSLHEIFPAPEVASSNKLTLLTLSFTGDCEIGAAKFVLAAREISERLRLNGYWADFMNPFSGKPFYSWANQRNLYKVDKRFRGLNMKLKQENNCMIITSENDIDGMFSGAIYTNGPSAYNQMKTILENRLCGDEAL